MKKIRKARFLIEYQNQIRKVFQLSFSNADSSLYFFPYSESGNYHFGRQTIAENQISKTFNFKSDQNSKSIPKLSIHESGQIHIKADDVLAGPIKIPPLGGYSGQHIATVCPDSFNNLPELTGKLSTKAKKCDFVLPIDKGQSSGRFAVFLNAHEPNFHGNNCFIQFKLERRSLSKPLYCGVMAIQQDPLGQDSQSGVTIITGWNPLNGGKLLNEDLLFIRGE